MAGGQTGRRRAIRWCTLGIVVALLAAARPGVAPAAELTSAQLAGQRIVYAYQGLTPPPGLLTRIRRGEAGAVILFAGNVTDSEQVRRVVGDLQAIPRPAGLRQPLLVMVDQEGGPVRRLPGGPERSAADIGAGGSSAAAEQAGRAAGTVLRAAGVNVNLAPVADAPRPGTAMEREGRAFGRDPERVARLASAYADGLWVSGVAATAKHFPGFGPSPVNTDAEGVTLPVSLEELRRVDQVPFATLIEREIPLVMLSTAIYPALDSHPAALSRRIATEELRGRLGFAGVSISDALDTPALAPFGGVADSAVVAAGAGTDLLIYTTEFAAGDAAARALTRAIDDEILPRERARESLARILALRTGLAGPDGLERVPPVAEAWALARTDAALSALGW